MIVKEYLSQFVPSGFFILDSHQEAMNEQELGHQHADSDFVGYSYNIHKYNQLSVGSFFLYRRPGKLSVDGKFHIYGGGVVDSIVATDDKGNVIANITHAFKLNKTIDQGMPFIENYDWFTREKPGPGWKGFWVNYGMNRIDERDFWNLIAGQECEIVKEEAVLGDEEHELIEINSNSFVLNHIIDDPMLRRVSHYAKRLMNQYICKIDFEKLNKHKKDIGTAGELIVLDYENNRLKKAGKSYRAEHVASTIGDGLGYDILSYDENGNEIHIEVKTTKTANRDNFYMTQRELIESKNEKYIYKIYRLYNFDSVNNSADMEIYEGAVSTEKYELIPTTYIIKKK